MISVSTKVNKDISDELVKNVLLALGKAATEMETEIKKSITEGQKSGVVYPRGNKTHTASAPGQAPANDSGKLAGSVRYKKISDKEHEVKINAEYALALEVGTKNMEARPFIMPAVLKAKKKLYQALKALRKR